ncbi:MAG: hypothetical protein ACLRTQ_00895 [Candidatus Borkfalkia sp.]
MLTERRTARIGHGGLILRNERAAFERFEKGERAAFVALNRRYVDAVKELFKQEGKG